MEAVILIGIPGSGKSTFYRERFFETHVRINLDQLRTRRRERILLDACLSAGQPFVVDNTNVRAADRAVYIEAARRAGFRVTGYFLETGLGDALRRNTQRSGKARVPPAAVGGTLKRLERPSPGEGFDELYIVSRSEGDRFLVRAWEEPGNGAAP